MARTRVSLATRAGRAVRSVRNGVSGGFRTVFRRGKGRVERVQEHADTMTLQEHMMEFRNRLVKALLGVIVGTIAGFFFAGRVINYMLAIATSVDTRIQILTLEPTEGFATYFTIALYIGIIVASPIVFYQIVRFLAPGLLPHELKYLMWGIPVASSLFIGGAVFANIFVIPSFIHFLITFTFGIGLDFTPTASNYLRFFIRLSLGMGLVFQLPALLFLLVKIRVVQREKLQKWRKWAFLLCTVAAAAIVPTPDPVNMFMVQIPMYALYEVGTSLSYFALPRGERGTFINLPRLKARN